MVPVPDGSRCDQMVHCVARRAAEFSDLSQIEEKSEKDTKNKIGCALFTLTNSSRHFIRSENSSTVHGTIVLAS